MLKSVAYSVKGSRSEENEDSYFINARQGVFLVADGVGGGPNGREASKAVVKEFALLTGKAVSKSTIVSTIEMANENVRKLAESTPVKGMASTIALLWVDGVNAVAFNVGDSRVYRINSGKIDQITTDHSRILENEQKSKNMITNAIGARSKVDVEINTVAIRPLDCFLIVSDGISDSLSDMRIAEISSSETLSLLEKCMALATEAENKGGRDDKTIILVATS